MADLILRPSGLPEKLDKPWSLQLRWHECMGETEYQTLCRVDDHTALEIIRAGQAIWLFGSPDWEARGKARRLEQSRGLREASAALEGDG